MNIVSFGGGVNSTAMIIGMFRKGIPIDLIIFADTGGEQPHTYEFIQIFNEWLQLNGIPAITHVYYHTKDGNRLALEDECLKSGTLPSIAYGYKGCSDKHKIRPNNKFCNNHEGCKKAWADGEKVNKFIGFDAGEKRRVEHVAARDAKDKKYNKHYLLYDWGWNRDKCIEVIASEGLPIPPKSSCFFCPSMKKAEIVELYKNNRPLFDRAVFMEENAKPNLTSIAGLGRRWSWGDFIKTHLETEKWEEAQTSMFDDPTGVCLCGAPCGCYDG